ncbi:MAG: GatB/YqeY domain-containing protein [Bacteroidales bacterium]|jgi:uncharacterized protein YqeY
MKISQQVNEEMKSAMRSRDKITLEALRAAKTAFTLARTKQGAAEELTDEEEVKIIQKLVKQRNESAGIYKDQGREDLYDKETAELKVLEKYLPAKLSDEDLRDYLKTLVERTGAVDQKDMGKVMGIATKELTGKADGKEIASIVRELLTK